jgi:anhydro-N-acetylmuramic acid kinase
VVWYIGLMSGTSLDGVDGVLAAAAEAAPVQCVRHAHRAMPALLRDELLALSAPGDNELHRAALAANALMFLYAAVVQDLLAGAGIAAAQVTAIGAHGQTVRHRPREFDGTGYTLQLMNGALLAERTGIAVVCDFRSRDLAAGGTGAPLVPAFHAARFAEAGVDIAVLNLGGIANLTLLDAQGSVSGFDCGPGNVLLDLWSQRHRGLPFDTDGAWAAGGRVDPALLERMLAEPYFACSPPKSTGRDQFNPSWLEFQTATTGAGAQDVMATLAELTAQTVCAALARHAPDTRTLLVCGGGAHNRDLVRRISTQLGSEVRVGSTAARGVAPDQVEALAFAWLASAFVARRAGNLTAVTGARAARVLGALYPAG